MAQGKHALLPALHAARDFGAYYQSRGRASTLGKVRFAMEQVAMTEEKGQDKKVVESVTEPNVLEMKKESRRR